MRDPRVAFSKEAFSAYLDTTNFYAKFNETPHYHFALSDTDVVAFIDYLAVAIVEPMEPLLGALRQHKDGVEEALHQNHHKPYVWSKYRWIAAYHNEIVRRYRLGQGLKVSGPYMQQRPKPIEPPPSRERLNAKRAK